MAEFNAQNAVSAQAPLLFSSNPASSPLLPRPYATTSPDFEMTYCLPPVITGSWGTTTTFDLLKNGSTALYPMLEFQLSAITPPPNSVASWVQYVGFELIDTITCRFGTNILQTITGHDLRLKHELMLRSDKNYPETILVNGNRTNAQLYSDALATLDLCVPLRALFWGFDLSKGFPAKHYANLLSLDVTIKPLSHVVNLWANQAAVGQWTVNGSLTPAAGAAQASIMKQSLRIVYSYLTDATNNVLSTKIKTSPGVIVPFQDAERVRDIIPVGAGAVGTPYSVNIDAARSPCVFFVVELRNQADLTTLWGMRYDNWQALKYFDVEGNQQKLIKEISHNQLLNVEWPRYFCGSTTTFSGNPFYPYTFSRNPVDSYNQYGSQYMGALHTPRLNITLNAAATVPIQVDVTFYTFNTIQMFGQDAKKNFF